MYETSTKWNKFRMIRYVSKIWESTYPADVIKFNKEYEILEILDSKIDKQRKCKLQYLVRWLGYEETDKETSWVPVNEVHTSEAISDSHLANPSKPGPLGQT